VSDVGDVGTDATSPRALARDRLPAEVFRFLDGSAGDGSAADGNLQAFARRRLVPRVLRDVSDVVTTTEVLGQRLEVPIGIAPLPRLAGLGRDGELDLARAAAATGTLYCAPTNASRSLEDLSVDGAPRWFQLYVHADAGITRDLVDRAAAAGYQAVVVTVDRPVDNPRRPHPPAADPHHTDDYPNLRRYGGDEVLRDRHQPAFDLAAFERLCAHSTVPVVAKGVLHPDDAQRAVAVGCRGIWVSNHGGRLLHRVVSPLEVLTGILDAVGPSIEVHLDGGVRTASDVAMALALGARCVHLGRPVVYALVTGGEPAVRSLLSDLTTDLRTVLAALGATRPSGLTTDQVVLADTVVPVSADLRRPPRR
jgi:isopentenyl diphosphate isomerase/L-lactate dehydrogenase-like FMN-dependent dehydrogenase